MLLVWNFSTWTSQVDFSARQIYYMIISTTSSLRYIKFLYWKKFIPQSNRDKSTNRSTINGQVFNKPLYTVQLSAARMITPAHPLNFAWLGNTQGIHSGEDIFGGTLPFFIYSSSLSIVSQRTQWLPVFPEGIILINKISPWTKQSQPLTPLNNNVSNFSCIAKLSS